MSLPPENLGTIAAKGVAWIGGGQAMRQVIQVTSQLILVRLLVPDDFGLFGMALFFIGIGQLLADFGVGSAIVQSRISDEKVLSSCFWLNVGIALALALATVVASPWIAGFYGRKDVAPLVTVLSLNLVLSGVQVMPTALLYRDLRFGDLARAQVLGSFAGMIAAIGLAAAGAGVWALAAQPLVGTTANLYLTWRATGWLPSLSLDLRGISPLARFGASLLGTNIIGYGNRNIDQLLIGRVLGAGALGYYSMAVQLMLYPIQQVSSVIVRVLFPTLVQIRDDPPRFRAAYLKAVSTIAFVTFPLMGGLFVLADDFVVVVLGIPWLPMVPALKILTWVGMAQSIGTTVGVIYLVTGRPDIALKVTLLAAPVTTIGIAGGLAWGIGGVAAGYAIAIAVLFYYTVVTAYRLVGLTIADFHGAIVRPLLASMLMVAAVTAITLLLASWTPGPRLLTGIACGAALYLVLSAGVNRRQMSELLAALRSLRTRPQDA